VNGFGCASRERAEIRLDVKFANGSAEVENESRDNLSSVAEFLRKYPTTNVVIEGHTDNVGNARSNQVLSRKRAEAVKESLISDYNIAQERLRARGFGSERAISSNDTARGRADNRRVVANIAFESAQE
jgi:OOP family OmpA-OmpF porin